MNTELLLRVQEIDPAPPEDAVPEGVWNAQQVLEELQRRTDTPVPRRPRTYRRWLIAAVVAAAVLILIGGLGVLTRLLNDTDAPPVVNQIEPDAPPIVDSVEPEESPIVEPEESTVDGDGEAPWLIEDLPEGAESGTLATPSGEANWARLSDDGGRLPDSGQAAAWPSGFAIFQRPFNTLPPPAPVSRPARLWVSDDGIEWRVEPLPLDPAAQDASLTLADGVYWLMSSDPYGLWRSTDGATWDEYDPTGLLPPEPSGLFSPISSSLVTAGELTLSYGTFEADFPFYDFLPLLIDDYDSDRDEGCRTFRKLESGVFQIVGHQGDQPCPHQLVLRFEETETGLRVLNNATGTDLGEVLGADLSHIEQLTQGDNFFGERLLIIGDSEITPVETPWPARLPTEGPRVQAFFGAQGWVYAYISDDTGVSVWRTNDGRSWTNLGPPSFPNDALPTGSPWFLSSFGPQMALDTDSNPGAAWETIDGFNWTPQPEGQPDQTYAVRLESGWFANNGSRGGPFDGDEWWMHVDDTWVSLAELGIEDGRCGGATPTALDNTTTFFFGGGGGESCPDLWILSLEPSS